MTEKQLEVGMSVKVIGGPALGFCGLTGTIVKIDKGQPFPCKVDLGEIQVRPGRVVPMLAWFREEYLEHLR